MLNKVKTRNIMVKEGIHHNTVNYTTLPNSSMTNDLPVSSSVITPMSPIVCRPVSLGAYTSMSPDVSAPVLYSVIKPECPCVRMPVSLGVSSLHSSAIGSGSSDPHNLFLFHSLMPLLVSLKFQMGELETYWFTKSWQYMLSPLSSSMSLCNRLLHFFSPCQHCITTNQTFKRIHINQKRVCVRDD